MPDYPIPRPNEPLADRDGLPSRAWYNFWRVRLSELSGEELQAEIEEIARKLGSPDGSVENIPDFNLEDFLTNATNVFGQGSIQAIGTLADGTVYVSLVNDEDSPLPSYFYGTSPEGVKGWQPLLPSIIPNPYADYLTDPDGNYLTDPDGNFLMSQDGFPIPLEYGGTGGDYLSVTSNKFFASPADATGAPTFRALASPDISSSFKLVYVMSKDDLPPPVAGVITLADNVPYWFMNSVDLLGDRIVCGVNTVLIGNSFSSEILSSTGLSGALIESASSLRIDNLTLTAATGQVFDLDDAGGTILFNNLRITDSPTIGTIQNYGNILWNESVVSNSANLTLDGTIASFVSESSIWDSRAGQTIIIVPSTAVFTRRFRMLYCPFTVSTGETGINFSASATIPDESYILDNVNFSGGGTYLAGLTYTSNKAQFFNCVGITNTSAIAQYYMAANATATVIGATGTFVKIAGTTTPVSSLQQKFNTATTNRAQYTGAASSAFRVTTFASMSSSNNQLLRMRLAVNGTTLAESTVEFTTSGSGDASNIGTQALLTLAPNDYVEVFVTNDTATNNITVRDLNVIVTRQN